MYVFIYVIAKNLFVKLFSEIVLILYSLRLIHFATVIKKYFAVCLVT